MKWGWLPGQRRSESLCRWDDVRGASLWKSQFSSADLPNVLDSGVWTGSVVIANIVKAKLSIITPLLMVFGTACIVTAGSGPTNDGKPATTSTAATTAPTPASTTTAAPTTTATATPTTTATATPTTTATGTTPAPTPKPGVTGAWESASCGKRKYVRTIEFDAAGGFQARELVSPCPAGKQCIWSGILDIKGTYEIKLDKIDLKITQPAARSGVGEPFPTTLGIDKATSAPTETAGDGPLCVYTRAAAPAPAPTTTPKK